MKIEQDAYEEILDWAQHEFAVSFVIRVEEISWRLWRELRKGGLNLSEIEVEETARDIIKEMEPPPPVRGVEMPWGKGLAEHYVLVRKAYTDSVRRHVVDAVYIGLSLPTFPTPERLSLPNPDLFLYTRDGTIWIECETLTGEVSRQVSVLYQRLGTARQYTECYDRFVFAVPKQAHSYKRADIEHLIKANEAEELRISVVYL